MVVFILYCRGVLENVGTVKLNKSANLCFSVRNPQDANEVREKIVVDPTVLHEASKGDHSKHRTEEPSHFAMKWEHGAAERATLRILGVDSIVEKATDSVEGKKAKIHTSKEIEKALEQIRDMKGEDNGNYVPMLALECNGLEPYAFHPMGGEFTVTRENETKTFENVDLSDGDWSEYDMATGTVSITNFQSKFK